MRHTDSARGGRPGDGLSRRDFLRAGTATAGAAGLSLADLTRASASPGGRDVNCILLFLVGGPSQLDTWDLKPAAPSHVRGPFRPIQTNVPGIQICEHFPLMARMADRYAIARSVHHAAAPIHETGFQLLQTGRLFENGVEYPHFGAVLSRLKGSRVAGVPPFVVLPGPVGNTGVHVSHGQGAGFLGADHEPVVVHADPARVRDDRELLECVRKGPDAGGRSFGQTRAGRPVFSPKARQAFALGREEDALRSRYGRNTFGQSCLLARRLVEHGVRLVTVNMFDTVFDQVSWDCHADGGALGATLDDYRRTLCPMFDRAYTALLEDLDQRGMLETTLVVALGEFGRTPHLNSRGGRDHWPGCWSVLFAGAGVRGGQVIGASDRHGAEPKDRPITAAEVAATVCRGLGIDPETSLLPERGSLAVEGAPHFWELLRG